MSKGDLVFRTASRDDVKSIVRLLADDALGTRRERYQDPLPSDYYNAFSAIDGDHNNELVVACKNEQIVGVLQLTFIPYLTYEGGWRALIEGVRVDATLRSKGVGRAMFEWAIARAKQRGCHLVQLTTDKSRSDARRFYESLGFQTTHDGMKLHLK
ncbi:MAG: GNAT family N-acetyltransferase [Gammaproteobacteria bacterium]|jgi:GNAT superfamily N-acetyltransferase|nr:GNAT family N-acetyltransferase [Gammaproteobacteria bacterium]